jgi:hypothetical protein
VTDDARAPAPPAWIHKRDGRLVPFEADKISRGLFAATETIGRPDAFLARELTDSVLHFLTNESDSSVPTTPQVGELVVKIVRELGQPTLAQAFVEFDRQRRRAAGAGAQRVVPNAPALGGLPADQLARLVEGPCLSYTLSRSLGATCLKHYSLQEVFTRDLAAAHADGLLALGGLDAPRELAGTVLVSPANAMGLIETLEAARQVAGEFLVLDGPEYALMAGAEGAVSAFARELVIGLRLTGLRAVVNLNCATAPMWADDMAEGPLFRSPTELSSDARSDLGYVVGEQLLGANGVRLDWHLSEADFVGEARHRLVQLGHRAREGAPIAFVFDRPRRSVALAEGVNRGHSGVLIVIGLDLVRLAQLAEPQPDLDRLLHKLGSLARLATTAGLQKRNYLRRHGRAGVNRAFLLERARLVIVPIGLPAVAQACAGHPLAPTKVTRDMGRRILQSLATVLREEAQRSGLETCIDSAPFCHGQETVPERAECGREILPGPEPRIGGLTAWEPGTSLKSQVRTASPWHAAAGAGTAVVVLGDNQLPTLDETATFLRFVWEETDVVRLCFARTQSERAPEEPNWWEDPAPANDT